MAGAAGDGGGGPYERQGASGGDGAYAAISVCGLLAPAPSPSPCQDFENTPVSPVWEQYSTSVWEQYFLCVFASLISSSNCPFADTVLDYMRSRFI